MEFLRVIETKVSKDTRHISQIQHGRYRPSWKVDMLNYIGLLVMMQRSPLSWTFLRALEATLSIKKHSARLFAVCRRIGNV